MQEKVGKKLKVYLIPTQRVRVHFGVKTCEVFLCFIVIVRVRVYYVDFFVFFVHW